MFQRSRAMLLAALAVTAALGASTAPALAAKGQFSIGGNFGTSITNGGAFNDSLKASIGSQYEDMAGDWDFGGSLRYGVSDKLSLDLEFNKIKAKSTTTVGPDELVATEEALAIPLNLVYALTTNDNYDFNFVVGAGLMTGTKWKLESKGTSPASEESKSKSALYAQGGFEGMYKLSPQFALTARALGRLAKASDVEWTDDPDTKFDVDMSGVAFSVGLRAFFGGTGQ
jgi:hypothetical protein